MISQPEISLDSTFICDSRCENDAWIIALLEISIENLGSRTNVVIDSKRYLQLQKTNLPEYVREKMTNVMSMSVFEHSTAGVGSVNKADVINWSDSASDPRRVMPQPIRGEHTSERPNCSNNE